MELCGLGENARGDGNMGQMGDGNGDENGNG